MNRLRGWLRPWILANLTLTGVMTVFMGVEFGPWALLLGVAMWLLGLGMMFEVAWQLNLSDQQESCACDCPDHEGYHDDE